MWIHFCEWIKNYGLVPLVAFTRKKETKYARLPTPTSVSPPFLYFFASFAILFTTQEYTHQSPGGASWMRAEIRSEHYAVKSIVPHHSFPWVAFLLFKCLQKSLGASRQMYGPRNLPQNTYFPWMEVMTPFVGFSDKLWCFNGAACTTSLLACHNNIRKIKQMVPIIIPLPIQGHFLSISVPAQGLFWGFSFFLNSWKGASWSCVRLIRLLAGRINTWRICLFPLAVILPSVSSVNKRRRKLNRIQLCD